MRARTAIINGATSMVEDAAPLAVTTSVVWFAGGLDAELWQVPFSPLQEVMVAVVKEVRDSVLGSGLVVGLVSVVGSVGQVGSVVGSVKLELEIELELLELEIELELEGVEIELVLEREIELELELVVTASDLVDVVEV